MWLWGLGDQPLIYSPQGHKGNRGWDPTNCQQLILSVPWKSEGGFFQRRVGKQMSQNGWSLHYSLVLFYDCCTSRERKTIDFSLTWAIGGCIFYHPLSWEDLPEYHFSKSLHRSDNIWKQMMMNYPWEPFLLHVALLEGNICLVAGSCRNSARAEGLERLIFIPLFLPCNSLTFSGTALGIV